MARQLRVPPSRLYRRRANAALCAAGVGQALEQRALLAGRYVSGPLLAQFWNMRNEDAAATRIRVAVKRAMKSLSEQADDFSPWPFGSVTLRELDTLPALKLFERDALKRRRVEEQVLARRGRDESETPVGQALDRSFSHFDFSSQITTSTANLAGRDAYVVTA